MPLLIWTSAGHMLNLSFLVSSIVFVVDEMKIAIQDSFIKGYHIFCIRPHPEVTMVVRQEENNKFDHNIHSLWMPSMADIPILFRGAVTRPAKNGKPEQTVAEIAGRMVGRVPANLGEVFKDLKDSIISIKWYDFPDSYRWSK